MSQIDLKRSAKEGAFWSIVSTAISKAASFFSQFALGWMLSKEDFGLFAIATTFAAYANILKDGGTTKLLIQQGHRQKQFTRPIFQIATCFNLIASIALLACTPLAIELSESQAITWLLVIFAANLAIGSPLSICRAQISYNLNFKTLNKASIASSITRHASMIMFAFLGFGVFSFAIPVLIATVTEWLILKKKSPGIPPKEQSIPFNKHSINTFLSKTKWIVAGTLAATLLTQGDYLVLALTTSTSALGVYFFSFQLSTSVSNLFTTAMQQVFLPAFSHIRNSPGRLNSAFLSTLKHISSTTAPLCLSAMFLTPTIVNFAWQGKWDEAIPITQILFLSLPIRLCNSLPKSILEATGKWKTQSCFYLFDGLTFVVSIFSASIISNANLILIAATVSLHRSSTSIILLFITSKAIGTPFLIALKALKRSILSYAYAFLAMAAIFTHLESSSTPDMYLLSFLLYTAIQLPTTAIQNKSLIAKQIHRFSGKKNS